MKLRFRIAAAWTATVAAAGLALAFSPPSYALVGGYVEPDPQPYIGSMQDAEGTNFCASSLIAARWAVTALHCVSDYVDDPSLMQVRFGSNDHTTGGELVSVAKVHIPPGGGAEMLSIFGRDVALLELATPMVGIKPIQLASSAPAVGTDIKLMGWGVTCGQSMPPLYYCGTPPTELRSLHTTISPDSNCQSIIGGITPGKELCTGAFFQSQGTCYGDSGAPAVADGVLSGVSSRSGQLAAWGNCDYVPAVYTDVSAYRSWITQVAGL
jgi:secreted trypsin-like serine protease